MFTIASVCLYSTKGKIEITLCLSIHALKTAQCIHTRYESGFIKPKLVKFRPYPMW